MWHVFPPQQASDQENALHRVPTSFPVRLTQNEALCHCQIALPSCRSVRNILKVIMKMSGRKDRRSKGKGGGGRDERGTDIENLQKNGRQIRIHYDR